MKLHAPTLRAAIAVCERIAHLEKVEQRKAIAGEGDDEWGDHAARSAAAGECARALAALLADTK
jgi:hypothetical protein